MRNRTTQRITLGWCRQDIMHQIRCSIHIHCSSLSETKVSLIARWDTYSAQVTPVDGATQASRYQPSQLPRDRQSTTSCASYAPDLKTMISALLCSFSQTRRPGTTNTCQWRYCYPMLWRSDSCKARGSLRSVLYQILFGELLHDATSSSTKLTLHHHASVAQTPSTAGSSTD